MSTQIHSKMLMAKVELAGLVSPRSSLQQACQTAFLGGVKAFFGPSSYCITGPLSGSCLLLVLESVPSQFVGGKGNSVGLPSTIMAFKKNLPGALPKALGALHLEEV